MASYPLEGDSTELEQSLEGVIAALARSIDRSTEAQAAMRKLTEEEKKAKEAADRLKEAEKAKAEAFKNATDMAGNLTEVLGFGIDVVGKMGEAAVNLASGFVDLVREVAEAKDELQGFISREDRDRVEELGDRLEQADRAALLLKTTLATELTPEIDLVIDAFIGAAAATGDLVDGLRDIINHDITQMLAGWALWLQNIQQGGATDALIEAFDRLAGSGEEVREELEQLTEAEEEWNAAIAEGERLAALWAKEAEEGKRRAKQATDELKRAEDKAHDARVKAVEEQQRLTTKEGEDRLKAEEALQADLAKLREKSAEARLDAIEEEAQAAADAIEEMEDAEKQRLEDRVEQQKEAAFAIAEAWTELFTTIADLELEASQAELDRIHSRQDALREQLKEAEGAEKKRIRAKLDGLAEEEEVARQVARSNFQTSQAAAVANVLASGAAAFAAMLVTFAALGPGAPLAAGAVVGPSVGAQLAVISKNKPPAHSGGAFGADEFFVGNQMARRGEQAVIFNQRAVETGAVDRAMAENRGGRGGGMGPAMLVITDGNRTIAHAVARDARRPGSPLAAAFGTVGSGVVDPWRRR